MPKISDNIPPQALELEESVLGAILLEPHSVDPVLGILKPESFYKTENQIIFAAIAEMQEHRQKVDLLTVTAYLRKSGKLESAGGPVYVTQLTGRVASAAHVEQHAAIVQDAYIQRELINIGTAMTSQAYQLADPLDIISEAHNRIDSILQDNQPGHAEHVSAILKRRIPEIESVATKKTELIGIPSGLLNLDRITGGWQNTDLIIIAARPSQGKTALSLFAAIQAASFKFPVAYFSLEMSKPQLIDRILSALTTLSPLEIRSGRMDWALLEAGITKLEGLPLFIDDTPALSLTQLRAKVLKLKRQNIKLIVVDYLQLMKGEIYKDRKDLEVASISAGLKALAKEMNIPVIALSQLNREADGKRPVLANLRESGAIEQDADMVIFIHRPEKYGEATTSNGRPTKGLVELIVEKHRNGPTGLIECWTNNYCTRFSDQNDFTNDNVPY